MNRNIFLPIAMILILMLVTANLFSQTAVMPSGSGTSGDPYLVATLNNLYWVTQNDTAWDATYLQTADIDASSTSTWDSGSGFLPIGDAASPRFTGKYDGDGHTVIGLFISRSSINCVGMFGNISNAEIKNLGVLNVNITGGSLTGGLIGSMDASTVSNCYSTGTVSGSSSVGGLVGELYFLNSSSLTKSYSTANVTGSGNAVGGLVGENNGGSTVSNCYSRGNVHADGVYAGGLVGASNSSTVSNSFATGSVSGGVGTYIGGLVGYNNSGTVSNGFWDTQTSGNGTSDGGTGKTSSQMKMRSTFTAAGWDFVDETTNGAIDIWNSDGFANNGYPFFSWEDVPDLTPSGSGTSGDPYLVSTANELLWIALNSHHWDKYFKQTADIDASSISSWESGSGFPPIGLATSTFSGNYDGDHHRITDLTIVRSSTSGVAMFGFTDGADIRNLALVDVNISGKDYVGGLIGFNINATLSECSVSGTVTGSSTYIGGCMGGNSSSMVSNCYSTANTSSTGNYVGGFCGFTNGSIISNCYSTGSVSGVGGNIGGFAGYDGGSAVNNCFWDTQASGQAGSAAASGKTTAEMKTQSTFTGAGWSGLVWSLDAGFNSGYPYLAWENGSGTPLPVELVSFTVLSHQFNTELKWTTATEVSNAGWEVERKRIPLVPSGHSLFVKGETSEASGGFAKVGFVEGSGNSNSPKEYSFVDKNLKAGKYSYRLKQIDNDGKFKYSQEVEVVISQMPQIFSLMQNYPNPFNPTTTIGFTLQLSGFTTLKVYDEIGREVAELFNGMAEAGKYYSLKFNAAGFSSGTYFVRLQNGNNVQMKKMLMLK